jgi:hypothetical protein
MPLVSAAPRTYLYISLREAAGSYTQGAKKVKGLSVERRCVLCPIENPNTQGRPDIGLCCVPSPRPVRRNPMAKLANPMALSPPTAESGCAGAKGCAHGSLHVLLHLPYTSCR